MNVPNVNFDLSPSEAIALQKQMASQVEIKPLDLSTLRTVAGIDASYKDGGTAAVVVLSYPDMAVLETVTASVPITFPYIPGLLSFRESPAVLAALAKLQTVPGALMVDGMGLIHPRRFGIACHLGVLCGLPSVGVGKTPFVGKYESLGDAPGDTAPLMDKGEQIGTVLRSKLRTNPLFVSVGNQTDNQTALALVQSCLRGYRLPEPTRQAHNAAGHKGD